MEQLPSYNPMVWPLGLYDQFRGLDTVAADLPSSLFLQAILCGTDFAIDATIGLAVVGSIVSKARNNQPFLKTVSQRLGFTGDFRLPFKCFKYGQIIALTIAAANYTIYPKQVTEQRREHEALIGAEKNGDITDLKDVFGDRKFARFQSGWSIDKISWIGIGVMASITTLAFSRSFRSSWGYQTLLIYGIPRWQFIGVASCGSGAWCGVLAHQSSTGGTMARIHLEDRREARWQESKSDRRSKVYLGGDHLAWLEKYREARRNSLGRWDDGAHSKSSA